MHHAVAERGSSRAWHWDSECASVGVFGGEVGSGLGGIWTEPCTTKACLLAFSILGKHVGVTVGMDS